MKDTKKLADKLTKQQKILIAVLLLAFAAAKIIGLIWWKNQQPEGTVVSSAACDVRQGCTLPNGAVVVFPQISTKMPFEMRVDNAPEYTQTITVRFSMRDMDMGFNRYDLARQADGLWFRSGNRLPACVQGRHDWLADIVMDDTVFQVAFSTE